MPAVVAHLGRRRFERAVTTGLPEGMLMHMDEQTGSIKVHLVHGTWANGLMRPQQTWFDRGSAVYQLLRNHLPPDTEIESFTWSGQNSIASRTTAAESFCQYLQSSVAQHPHTDHIIVAHSHGGTVAADALSRLSERSTDLSSVKGLICLATPFVHLVKPSLAQMETGLIGFAALLNALVWSALLTIFPFFPTMLSSIGLGGLVVFATGLLPLFVVAKLARRLYDEPELQPSRATPTDVPIFLLRATRDEASLSFGLMQAFNLLLSAFSRHIDMQPVSVRKPVAWVANGVVHAMAFGSFLVLGLLFAKLVESQLGAQWPSEALPVIGLFIYAPGIAGAVYFVGYALLAMVAGHTKILAWLTTAIEVDAAPPEVFCQLKIYTMLNASSKSLRHSLYENEDVIRDVGSIVSRLSSRV